MTVYGAVRSEISLKKLKSFHIQGVVKPQDQHPFWSLKTLVIAISPRHDYLETLKQIAASSQGMEQFILLSTTSVYGEAEGEVDESSLTDDRLVAMQGEQLFLELFEAGVIIRLGGLMGPGRIAGQWSRAEAKESPVNLIHQRDAVGIIEAVIAQEIKAEIINAVAPQHPLRSELYGKNSQRFGFSLPRFVAARGKVVLSEKSQKVLGYSYRFEDPMHFDSDSLDRDH